MAEYHVILIEKDNLMLERLSRVIHNTKGFELAARYAVPQDAVQAGLLKPNLILLDTDDSENIMFIPLLHQQFPQAFILCCGTHWHARSANQMLRSGAAGYLIKPFTGDELITAARTFHTGRIVRNVSEVSAFFSPKGKSGKTTLIANLALSLARKTGKSIGIIDADLQFGDMAVFFDLKPLSTIFEAVRDVKSLSPLTLSSYFVPVNENVSVLCGTKHPELAEQIKMPAFVEMIHMAHSLFRYILIDLPSAFNPISVTAADIADKVYMTAMNNDSFEINHMQHALKMFRETWPDNYKEKVRVIFTRVTPCTNERKSELEHILQYPIMAVMPNEYMLVSSAANNGRMAIDVKPESDLSYNIDRLADLIRGRSDFRWENS